MNFQGLIATGVFPIALLSAFSSGGCGSGGGNDNNETPPTEACNAYAIVSCSRDARCREKSSPSCVAVAAAYCSRFLDLPDSGFTANYIRACTSALEKSDCEDFPRTCDEPKGTAPPGSTCIAGIQCTSGKCVKEETGSCGVCLAVPAVGQPCNGICEEDAYCKDTDQSNLGICTAYQYGALGSSCDPKEYKLCASGLSCIDEVCAVTPPPPGVGYPCNSSCDNSACIDSVCVAYAGEGEECEYKTINPCDYRKGLLCKTVPGEKIGVCTGPTFANIGEPCGQIDGEYVKCVGGACTITAGNSTGTCTPQIPYGGACTEGGAGGEASQPSGCEEGLFCIDGKCDIEPFPVCN